MFHALFEKARPTIINGGANSTLALELIASQCPWVHDLLLREPMPEGVGGVKYDSEGQVGYRHLIVVLMPDLAPL